MNVEDVKPFVEKVPLPPVQEVATNPESVSLQTETDVAGERPDAAVTRSQKRKRDQEEALVVRLGDCSKFLRRKPRPRAGVPTLRMARSMTPPLARSCFFVRGQRPFRQETRSHAFSNAGEESLGRLRRSAWRGHSLHFIERRERQGSSVAASQIG